MEETGRINAKAATGMDVTGGAPAAGPAVAIEIMPAPATAAHDPATRKRKAAKPKWPPFEADGVSYVFEHLADFAFTCRDSDGVVHTVLVTFTDHVFTRNALSSDEPAHAFPGCSRQPHGYLCPTRYRMSFQLPALIEQVATQRVWSLTGADRYAQVPVVDDQGTRQLYAIVFSLDRISGLEQPLRMIIRSAHLCDRKPPDTFGEVRFAHLIKLRLGNKHPAKNHSRGRKQPRMP